MIAPVYILGLNGYVHIASASLLRDGELVACAEEERFTRVKYDGNFPGRSILFCLEQAGIGPADIDVVVFYYQPWRGLGRRALNIVRHLPHSLGIFGEHKVSRGTFGTLRDFIMVRRTLAGLGFRAKVVFAEHHLCHAANFFASGLDEAAVLSIDLAGEIASTFLGHARGNRIEKLGEIFYPHSLGVFYGALTQYLGYEANSDEYKVMGLASYGRPTYYEAFKRLVELRADGTFRLDLRYFDHHLGRDLWYSKRFVEEFGPPCPREEDLENERFRDLAASAQKVFEETVDHLASHLQEKTGSRNLFLVGGCALNGVANGRLLAGGAWDRIDVPPAAYDASCSLGGALLYWHQTLGKPRGFQLRTAAWGPAWTDDDCLQAIKAAGLVCEKPPSIEQAAANLLSEGRVVAWFQGRMEWGPRALGQRSILADPRQASMKDEINRRVKFREPYRPFAPSVLAEKAAEYFDLPIPSPYMCLVVPVKEAKRSVIPAVTHVDGTARPQTVSREASPRYYKLIEEFERLTGVPVLLNTSYNVRGEPIVCSPSDAIATFLKTNIEVLVLENFLCRRPLSSSD